MNRNGFEYAKCFNLHGEYVWEIAFFSVCKKNRELCYANPFSSASMANREEKKVRERENETYSAACFDFIMRKEGNLGWLWVGISHLNF